MWASEVRSNPAGPRPLVATMMDSVARAGQLARDTTHNLFTMSSFFHPGMLLLCAPGRQVLLVVRSEQGQDSWLQQRAPLTDLVESGGVPQAKGVKLNPDWLGRDTTHAMSFPRLGVVDA